MNCYADAYFAYICTSNDSLNYLISGFVLDVLPRVKFDIYQKGKLNTSHSNSFLVLVLSNVLCNELVSRYKCLMQPAFNALLGYHDNDQT